MLTVVMALLEKQLQVKRSEIPKVGHGLFTKEFIPKGTLIVEYKGRIRAWKEVEYDSENGYLYSINDRRVIDAKRTKKALARYANDACGINKVKGITNNAVYVNDDKKAFIKSVKNIGAGAEILVRYGREYWMVRRANLAIDRLAGKQGK